MELLLIMQLQYPLFPEAFQPRGCQNAPEIVLSLSEVWSYLGEGVDATALGW